MSSVLHKSSMGYNHETIFFLKISQKLYLLLILKCDKHLLLIISGRYKFGKILIVIREFLSNERAWIFLWIFTNVLLVSSLSFIFIKIDDCPQEFMQVDMTQEIFSRMPLG